MRITNELLESGKSLNGAWGRKQLKALRVKWPLKKGWKRRIIGKDLPDAAINEFLLRKNEHLIEDDVTEMDYAIGRELMKD